MRKHILSTQTFAVTTIGVYCCPPPPLSPYVRTSFRALFSSWSPFYPINMLRAVTPGAPRRKRSERQRGGRTRPAASQQRPDSLFPLRDERLFSYSSVLLQALCVGRTCGSCSIKRSPAIEKGECVGSATRECVCTLAAVVRM